MKLGGTPYEIIYSETIEQQDQEFRTSEFLGSHLPVDVVCALVSKTYSAPSTVKQAVLDALSPFQIVSKLWASSVLSAVVGDSYERSPVVFFGSWFGQLNSIIARKINGYHMRKVVLIDKDPYACDMANWLREQDQWLEPHTDLAVVCGDVFDFDLSAFADECGAEPIVVWCGVEHFDAEQTKRYIVDHAGTHAMYLLQGTNMPADDHRNLITSCGALEQYFDGTPIYSAELKTPIGSRFQLVFAT